LNTQGFFFRKVAYKRYDVTSKVFSLSLSVRNGLRPFRFRSSTLCMFRRNLLHPYSTLKTETLCSSETFVPIYQTTLHHIPGNRNVNSLKPSGHYIYHLLYHTKTLHSAHTVYLCVPYGSHNKQRLFLQTALTGLAL
jgi:hypothetical protein